MNNSNCPDHSRFSRAVSAGLRVFPLRARGKEPLAKWKEYGDTPATDGEIATWNASNYNVGVICGEPSGIIVIDVDSTEAQEFVDHLALPPTPVVRTGKGKHYYFQCPPVALSNRVGVEGLKLDVRADGGYVVGAGSIHPNGSRYEWELSPDDVPFASMPAALFELVRKQRRTPNPSAPLRQAH